LSGRTKAGILISFEGIDASGKNAQSRMLFDYLKKSKVDSDYLSFPDYSTPIGKEIRNYLSGTREYNAETRHLLYAANRYEWKERIEDRVRQGINLVLNRYSESNFAYGVANGLTLSWLQEVEARMPRSDLVFYLKIPPEVSAKRKGNRDRFESDLSFLKRVSEVYDALAEPGRWFTIDATRSMDLVHYEIGKILENVFPHITAASGPSAQSKAVF
jgi:dTMP kinase